MPTNVSEMNLEDMILAYLRDKQQNMRDWHLVTLMPDTV